MTYKRKEVIGDCTLYLGDCLEVMPALGKVDAVVTDPPYFKVKGEVWDNQWENSQYFLKWLGQVLDVCADLMEHWASIYCFASPQMEWEVQGIVRERFVFLNSIRWVKKQGWHQKQPADALRIYQQNWEACIFAQKGFDKTNFEQSGYDSACKILKKEVFSAIGLYFQTERERAGLKYRQIADFIKRDPALYLRWEEGSSLPNQSDYDKCRELFNISGGEYLRKDYEELRKDYEELRKDYEELRRPFNLYDDRMRGDIWSYNVVNGYTGKHPCEKPLAIMQHIIGTSTKQNQTILDPFMGSGTTLVACAKMGRKGIGIELDPDYFNIACKRVEDAYRQGDLFINSKPEPEPYPMEQGEFLTTKPADNN